MDLFENQWLELVNGKLEKNENLCWNL